MPYSERYVAFLDILGFGNIVMRETQGQLGSFRCDQIAAALTEIGTDEAVTPLGDDFRFQTFSDSVVMSVDATPEGLTHILAAVTSLALRLLRVGLLTRGALAKGNLHHDNPVMFGPAFLEAYNAERTVAKYPRVVLSRDVHRDFLQLRPALTFPCVLLAEDGPPYVHIFAQFERLQEREDEMKRSCQHTIKTLLEDSIYEPNHYEKLRWLVLYWNSTAGRSSPIERIDFPIAENDPHPDFDKNDWLERSQANQKIKSQSDHWDLHLDYNPGQKTFGWTLYPHKAGQFE